LGFVSVLDFFGVLSFPKTGEMGKTELRPFLTILGTRMRAIYAPSIRLLSVLLKDVRK
jgi:hypothetical protein